MPTARLGTRTLGFRWKRTAIRLALVSLHLAAATLQAQSPGSLADLPVGARLRVEAPGVVPHSFVGTLLLPPADTLLLALPDGPPVVVRPSQITFLQVSRGRSSVLGALQGLVIGTPLGLGAGMLFHRAPLSRSDCVCQIPQRGNYAAAGVIAGAITGLVAGALVGHERWSRVFLPVEAR